MFNGLRLLSQLDVQLRSASVAKQRVALVLWPNTFIHAMETSSLHDFAIFATSCLLRLVDFFKDGNNQLRIQIIECISNMLRLLERKERSLHIFADAMEDVLKRIISVYSSNDPITKCLCLTLIKSLAALLANSPLVQYLTKMMCEWDSLFELAFHVSWYAVPDFHARIFEACLFILERVDEYNVSVRRSAFDLSMNPNFALTDELKLLQQKIPNLFQIK